MATLAPPRSGGKQLIFWLSKSEDELYSENCTVEGMTTIIAAALEADGDEQRQAAATGTNVVYRNVRTYIQAVASDAFPSLMVWGKPKEDRELKDVHEQVLEETCRQEGLAG